MLTKIPYFIQLKQLSSNLIDRGGSWTGKLSLGGCVIEQRLHSFFSMVDVNPSYVLLYTQAQLYCDCMTALEGYHDVHARVHKSGVKIVPVRHVVTLTLMTIDITRHFSK